MVFRRFVSVLAKGFPPKFAADRILPWTALILVTVGAGWTIYVYRNDVSIGRVQAVFDLYDVYRREFGRTKLLRSKPQELEAAIARIRCEVVSSTTDECETLTGSPARRLLEIPLTCQQRTTVRKKMNSWRAKNEDLDTRLAYQYQSFFDAVRVCTQAGNCDVDTSLALFAKDITTYLNDVCVFVHDRKSPGRRETEKLAKFLLDHGVDKDISWSEDEGRQSLFVCDYLTKLGRRPAEKRRRPWLKHRQDEGHAMN